MKFNGCVWVAFKALPFQTRNCNFAVFLTFFNCSRIQRLVYGIFLNVFITLRTFYYLWLPFVTVISGTYHNNQVWKLMYWIAAIYQLPITTQIVVWTCFTITGIEWILMKVPNATHKTNEKNLDTIEEVTGKRKVFI